MLIVALILAAIGLAALITAVVTSNELVAWVCIGASALGVLLLIVDAIRDKARRHVEELPGVVGAPTQVIAATEATEVIPPLAAAEADNAEAHAAEVITADTTEMVPDESSSPADDLVEEDEGVLEDEDAAEGEDSPEADDDHPDELVHDDPDYDTPSDDEPDFPEPAEEAAIHTVSEEDLAAEEEAEEISGADDAAIEVHYASGAEDSAATVVYTYAEDTEIEYVEAGDPQVEEEQQRDQ